MTSPESPSDSVTPQEPLRTAFVRKPTVVADSQAKRVEDSIESFSEELDDHVETVLGEVDREFIRSQLESLVFSPNGALPKRGTRPACRLSFVARELYLSYDPEGTQLEEFVQFALVYLEYYDIVDDIFDGDVAEGTEAEVFATLEALQPLLVRHVHRLGGEAVSYWTDHAIRMVQCFLDELRQQPSASAYLDILEDQAEHIGLLTGIAAIVAGEDPATVESAETFGKHYFKFEQFLLDCRQHATDDPDPWNACRLTSEREVFELLSVWQSEMNAFLDDLPPERAENLRPLVGLDLETWLDQYE